MDSLIQILKTLVNPWTVMPVVFFVVFRREVKVILNSLTGFVGNVTEVRYKGLKISSEKKEELLTGVKEATLTKHGGQVADSKDVIERFSLAMKNEISADDLSLFNEIFSDSDTVVIRRGTKHEGSLYRLRDSGAVEGRKEVLTTPSKGCLQEWGITDIGRALRAGLKDLK